MSDTITLHQVKDAPQRSGKFHQASTIGENQAACDNRVELNPAGVHPDYVPKELRCRRQGCRFDEPTPQAA